MRRTRVVAAWAICWATAVAGCGSRDEVTATTAPESTVAAAVTDPTSTMPAVATSVPNVTEPATTVGGDFLTAAGAACSQASGAAYEAAEQLGYWDHPLTADEQSTYYTGRAEQVDDLIVALSGLQPSAAFAADWETTVGYLQVYAEWADANVVAIADTGSTVDETTPASLRSFRAAFELGYGHACQDLFDMN